MKIGPLIIRGDSFFIQPPNIGSISPVIVIFSVSFLGNYFDWKDYLIHHEIFSKFVLRLFVIQIQR